MARAKPVRYAYSFHLHTFADEPIIEIQAATPLASMVRGDYVYLNQTLDVREYFRIKEVEHHLSKTPVHYEQTVSIIVEPAIP